MCNASRLGAFATLLLRWRGSIYKLIYAEYLVWLAVYFTLSLVYRFALNYHQKLLFEVTLLPV